MKYFVFVCIVLFSFACKQKPANKTENEQTKPLLQKTTVVFNEKMHNFGKLKAGEIVVYTFEFTNSGTSDYQIKSIHSDCGCVHTNFTNKQIKPGETGQIEVEFDTSGLVGNEFKTIEVTGNSKELKHLAIFAEVKNEIISY